MTIDEAIKLCKEDAEKIGGNPQSDRHAERCRQLAEWLTELKEAEDIIRTCKRWFEFLLECQIENTLTWYKVETLLKNITEYLSGGSESGT